MSQTNITRYEESEQIMLAWRERNKKAAVMEKMIREEMIRLSEVMKWSTGRGPYYHYEFAKIRGEAIDNVARFINEQDGNGGYGE